MERHHWEVWLIAAIGLWVIISPHALAVPFTDETRAGAFRWSFVGPGCFVALLAISAMGRFYAWEAWRRRPWARGSFCHPGSLALMM
jgi:hypothetical protein